MGCVVLIILAFIIYVFIKYAIIGIVLFIMLILAVIIASVKNNSSKDIGNPSNNRLAQMGSQSSNDDVELVCSKCGTVATPEAKYCKKCGDKFE